MFDFNASPVIELVYTHVRNENSFVRIFKSIVAFFDYVAVSFPKNATDMVMARQLANIAGEAFKHKPQMIAKKKVLANPKIFLLTPEMATSVGEGMMADKFVKLMTALYEGHTDWKEGTRTSGQVAIKDCNINWCAGSTPPLSTRSSSMPISTWAT